MRAGVRAADTVARTGGDEFIVLVDGIRHRSDMATIRRNLEHALSGPAAVDGHLLEIRASIGTAVYPDDGTTADALLGRADQRMYAEKHSDRVRVLSVAKRH
jgi:diguanylate cyclase (GGDEF)-like protein